MPSSSAAKSKHGSDLHVAHSLDRAALKGKGQPCSQLVLALCKNTKGDIESRISTATKVLHGNSQRATSVRVCTHAKGLAFVDHLVEKRLAGAVVLGEDEVGVCG